MKPKALIRSFLSVLFTFGLTAGASAGSFFQAYVVVGEAGKPVARAVTTDTRCPDISIDGKPPRAMQMRAAAANVPNRGGAQTESKGVNFSVAVCDSPVPAGAKKISVAGVALPVPVAHPKRILIIGDTGCRMKGSENAFQSCNDPETWAFRTISETAAKWKPDLIVHLGDINYRESPCPADNAGCADSAWGYGFDTWNADFFQPGKALLRAAPWVAVRGNHESCIRAGQGWFRFLDPSPYDSRRSCDDPAFDTDGDFSEPYAVPIAADTQLIVFDSSKAAGKSYAAEDAAYKRYLVQLRQVDELARSKPHSFFLSHHPVLGFASGKDQTVIPGNSAMQSVMRALHPDRLFGPGIDLTLHGHVHLFESISFKSDHPSVFVGGNAGADLSRPLPAALANGAQPAPGAVVDEFFSSGEFGYLTMERAGRAWTFTEWDRHGKAMLRCGLAGAKTHCVPATEK